MSTEKLLFLQYLTTAFDSIDEAVLLIGVEETVYRLILVNEPFTRISGYKKTDEGRLVSDIISPGYYKDLVGHYRAAIDARVAYTYTNWVMVPAGQRAYCSKLVPIFDAFGTCTHLVAISKDVTEDLRKQDNTRVLEQYAQSSEDLLEGLTVVARRSQGHHIVAVSRSLMPYLHPATASAAIQVAKRQPIAFDKASTLELALGPAAYQSVVIRFGGDFSRKYHSTRVSLSAGSTTGIFVCAKKQLHDDLVVLVFSQVKR